VAQYLPILAMIVLAVIFALGSFLVSKLLAPRRATDKKTAPYECGIIPSNDPPDRFPVTFYLVAMIFIIFDIEIIFLYPWAVAHEGLGAFGLGAILIFSALLFESFVYLVGSGVMNWGPVKRIMRTRSGEALVSADRTSSTTVRKVGLEGRRVPQPAAERHETADDSDVEPVPAGSH
jgi:NADH-quinone oxidoreductase subunit A